MTEKKYFTPVAVLLSVLAAALAVALFSYATTIGNAVTVTGALTVNGNSTLGDSAADTITVTGVFQGFVSNASSTISAGVFNIGGSLGIASSTPSQELGVTGDAYISSTLGVATSTPGQELGVNGDMLLRASSGTTTLVLSASPAGVGGCLELKATDGTVIRIYATTSPSTSFATDVASSTASSRGLAIEAGSCQ